MMEIIEVQRTNWFEMITQFEAIFVSTHDQVRLTYPSGSWRLPWSD